MSSAWTAPGTSDLAGAFPGSGYSGDIAPEALGLRGSGAPPIQPVGVGVPAWGHPDVFDAKGRFLRTLGRRGEGDGEFADGLSHLAIDGKDRIYVVEGGLHRVQVFDRDGRFLHRWGSQGDGEGRFDHPYGIAVYRRGTVYVGDNANHRIQKFRRTR